MFFEIDVNVYLLKFEVKFRDERFVYNIIYKVIVDLLKLEKMIFKVDLGKVNDGNDVECEWKYIEILFVNLNDIFLVIFE